MMDTYEKRFNNLVKAYQEHFCDSKEEAERAVNDDIEEDCIESVEQNVADGLLCVG